MAKKATAKNSAADEVAKRPRGTGASYVYEEVRAQILNLELAPGTLLDETELGKRFNVSRSPVREALIRLSAEGLVRTLRNRSSIVSFLDISEIFGFFDALDLLYRVTARRAATAANAEAIEEIKKAADLHRDAGRSGDKLALVSTNQAFHLAVARASGNPYYEQWTKTLLDNGQRLLGLYMRHLGEPATYAEGEHPNLIRAIEERDPDAAEEAARRDASITSEEILTYLLTRGSPELRIGDAPISAEPRQRRTG